MNAHYTYMLCKIMNKVILKNSLFNFTLNKKT